MTINELKFAKALSTRLNTRTRAHMRTRTHAHAHIHSHHTQTHTDFYIIDIISIKNKEPDAASFRRLANIAIPTL